MYTRFQLFSDLHLEMRDTFPHIPRTHPIIILAGDIGHIESSTFINFMNYCSTTWDHVVFVPGNREFYSRTRPYAELSKAYESLCNSYTNVYFLDGHVLEVDDIVFFGATMWTPIEPKWDDGVRRVQSFQQTLKAWDDMRALGLFLKKYHTHPNKIVVTHFPIVRAHTCHEQYSSQPEEKKRYFSSDWLHFFDEDLWTGVHKVCSGHTHHSYRLKVVRGSNVVDVWSNQMGYPYAPDPLFVTDGDLFLIN